MRQWLKFKQWTNLKQGDRLHFLSPFSQNISLFSVALQVEILDCPEDFSRGCLLCLDQFYVSEQFVHFDLMINTLDGESGLSEVVLIAKLK